MRIRIIRSTAADLIAGFATLCVLVLTASQISEQNDVQSALEERPILEPAPALSYTVFNKDHQSGYSIVTGHNFSDLNYSKPADQYCYIVSNSRDGQGDRRLQFATKVGDDSVQFINEHRRSLRAFERKLATRLGNIDALVSKCVWVDGSVAS